MIVGTWGAERRRRKGDFGWESRRCSPFLRVKDCGEARWGVGDLRPDRGQGASVFEARPRSAPRSALRPKGRAGTHPVKAGGRSVAKGATGKWGQENGVGKFRTGKIGDFPVENFPFAKLPVDNRWKESNPSGWPHRARCPCAPIRRKPAGAAWRRERPENGGRKMGVGKFRTGKIGDFPVENFRGGVGLGLVVGLAAASVNHVPRPGASAGSTGAGGHAKPV